MPDDPGRLRDAAKRLQHDLGRYIRFGAPEELERDTEALRERLTRDVLGTRSTPEGVVPAMVVFEAWLAEEGGAFARAKELETLTASMRALGGLAAGLPELGRAELEELDRLTRSVADDCRRLLRRIEAGR
jgi:hypothetical protein